MRLTSTLLLLSLIACGSSGSGNGSVDGGKISTDVTTRYNPWKVGSRWSYQISQATKPAVSNRVTTIGPLEDVGGAHAGTMAYKVHIELYAESKDTWEAPLDSGLDVRYKTAYINVSNTVYDTNTDSPYRLHLDETPAHLVTGASYSETFMETDVLTGMPPTTKSETLVWTVISDSEPITVLAGSYTSLHLKRFNAPKNETIEYWYAKGVGKLKETGGATTEELMSFTP